jgi:hypothetical protein
VNKRKNDDRSDRNRFMLIATVLVLVLILGFAILVYTIVQNRANRPFSQTPIPFVTNGAVATLLAQTESAGTEQFIKTRTALP